MLMQPNPQALLYSISMLGTSLASVKGFAVYVTVASHRYMYIYWYIAIKASYIFVINMIHAADNCVESQDHNYSDSNSDSSEEGGTNSSCILDDINFLCRS